MELKTLAIPKSLKRLVIAPLGDIQWSGAAGPTASTHLRQHIDQVLAMESKDCGVFFVGVGDMIDFLSPSNRRKLTSADLYDTAKDVIAQKAMDLTKEVFDTFLTRTVGKWAGFVEGHHFFEAGGTTTDQILCEWLKAPFLGTSAFIKLLGPDITLYVHHGTGGGILPGAGLNKLYHIAAGLEGADIYLLGHDTKMVTTRLSRPFPDWSAKPPKLTHRDIWLVRCGGFSRSNIVGHRHGTIPRGDYAEQANMTPSPISAPIITINLATTHDRIRVSI